MRSRRSANTALPGQERGRRGRQGLSCRHPATPHASRLTPHASRLTPHASPAMLHVFGISCAGSKLSARSRVNMGKRCSPAPTRFPPLSGMARSPPKSSLHCAPAIANSPEWPPGFFLFAAGTGAKGQGERGKGKGERRKAKGERRKAKGERRKAKGERPRLPARMSHQPSTAAADLRAVAGRTRFSRLDVVSAKPAPSSAACTPPQRHLDALATNAGEITASLAGRRIPGSPRCVPIRASCPGCRGRRRCPRA
jgi:hypothetical protein